jgi:pyridoxine/pyridoxamine 5'-phosphate oxidase
VDTFETQTFLESTFANLESAARDGTPPLAWPALATVSPEGRPDARTVVLRSFDGQEARMFADARSSKIRDLHHTPFAALHFLDPQAMLQIRLYGSARIHQQDAVAEAYWSGFSERNRLEYQPVDAPGSTMTEARTPLDPRMGAAHFAVVTLTLTGIDLLQVGRKDHRRFRYERGDTGWTGSRVIP